MRAGILGSGEVARQLGRGFAELGHEVKLGTRHPGAPALTEWLAKTGPKASVGSFSEAAKFGEVVAIATLGSAAGDAIRLAGPEHFKGKTVIDVTNPLVFHENGPPTLFVGTNDSLGEQVQRWLPDAQVVKAFNTVGNTLFFQPKIAGGPADMLIAGNDADAKARVTKVLHEFGWSSVIDVGGIDGARWLEALCVLWVRSALAVGSWNVAFRLVGR
jgi:predicted dinucleotide-binding enzyme